MFKKFISFLALVSYIHQILAFTALRASEVLTLHPNNFQISRLSSQTGFSIETDSESDSEDESNIGIKKNKIHKITPSVVFDRSQQKIIESSLNFFKKFNWHQEGVDLHQDGLILSFDWFGNLKISGDGNYFLDRSFSFSNQNQITIGDNLQLSSLALRSPKIINIGKQNFISSLEINNLAPDQKKGLFINEQSSNLLIGSFTARNFDINNYGVLEVIENGIFELLGGNFYNQGISIISNFKDINFFSNVGSIIAKDLTVFASTLINDGVIEVESLKSEGNFFTNKGVIKFNNSSIVADYFYNNSDLIAEKSLDLKITSNLKNDSDGKIFVGDEFNVTNINQKLSKVEFDNFGSINLNKITFDKVSFINRGAFHGIGKGLLKNSSFVNTGNGLATIAQLDLNKASNLENHVENILEQNLHQGLVIDILQSFDDVNRILNLGFLKINLLKGVIDSIQNAGYVENDKISLWIKSSFINKGYFKADGLIEAKHFENQKVIKTNDLEIKGLDNFINAQDGIITAQNNLIINTKKLFLEDKSLITSDVKGNGLKIFYDDLKGQGTLEFNNIILEKNYSLKVEFINKIIALASDKNIFHDTTSQVIQNFSDKFISIGYGATSIDPADPVNYKGPNFQVNVLSFNQNRDEVLKWLSSHQKGKDFLASGTEYAKLFNRPLSKLIYMISKL